MTKVVSVIIAIFISTSAVAQDQEWATYKGDDVRAASACIFKIIAEMYRPNLDTTNLPTPSIIMADETSLEDFQKAAASHMQGFVPQQVTNVYVIETNTVYLVNNYTTPKTGRSAFDSLAHEFAHYFQVQVSGLTLENFSDAEEIQAVDLQTRFREAHRANIKDGRFECPR